MEAPSNPHPNDIRGGDAEGFFVPWRYDGINRNNTTCNSPKADGKMPEMEKEVKKAVRK